MKMLSASKTPFYRTTGVAHDTFKPYVPTPHPMQARIDEIKKIPSLHCGVRHYPK